jgi:hypothetical protein
MGLESSRAPDREAAKPGLRRVRSMGDQRLRFLLGLPPVGCLDRQARLVRMVEKGQYL